MDNRSLDNAIGALSQQTTHVRPPFQPTEQIVEQTAQPEVVQPQVAQQPIS